MVLEPHVVWTFSNVAETVIAKGSIQGKGEQNIGTT